MEINSSPLIKKTKIEKEKPKETESKPSVSCTKESYIDDMEIGRVSNQLKYHCKKLQ